MTMPVISSKLVHNLVMFVTVLSKEDMKTFGAKGEVELSHVLGSMVIIADSEALILLTKK